MGYSGRQCVGEVLHCWRGYQELGEAVAEHQGASVGVMERKVVYARPKREKGGQGTHAGETEWAEV